jgi:hypothetical protein
MCVNQLLLFGCPSTISMHVFALCCCWFVPCDSPEYFCLGGSLLYGGEPSDKPQFIYNHDFKMYNENRNKQSSCGGVYS